MQGLDYDDDTMVCAFAQVSVTDLAILKTLRVAFVIFILYSRELILVKEIVVDRLLAMAN